MPFKPMFGPFQRIFWQGARMMRQMNAKYAAPSTTRRMKVAFSESLGDAGGYAKHVDRKRFDVLLHPDDKGTRHGFDLVLREKATGNIHVVEQKGRLAQLSKAQRNPDQWVNDVCRKTIARSGNYARSTAKEVAVCRMIQEARMNGKAFFSVSATRIDNAGRVYSQTEKFGRLVPSAAEFRQRAAPVAPAAAPNASGHSAFRNR